MKPRKNSIAIGRNFTTPKPEPFKPVDAELTLQVSIRFAYVWGIMTAYLDTDGELRTSPTNFYRRFREEFLGLEQLTDNELLIEIFKDVTGEEVPEGLELALKMQDEQGKVLQ